MKDNEVELCPVCQYPLDQDVCCPECGHDCLLEKGEPYCPVCSPEPKIKPNSRPERL